MTDEELPRFRYGLPDIYDGSPWSASDIEDLKGHVAHGASLEETAAFLCRAGTPVEVAAKAKELGLNGKRAARAGSQTSGLPRLPRTRNLERRTVARWPPAPRPAPGAKYHPVTAWSHKPRRAAGHYRLSSSGER